MSKKAVKREVSTDRGLRYGGGDLKSGSDSWDPAVEEAAMATGWAEDEGGGGEL